MTAGPVAFSRSVRIKLLLLLSIPVLTASSFFLVDLARQRRADDSAAHDPREELLTSTFSSLLAQASQHAEAALASSTALRLPAGTGGALSRRLEGVGLLGPDNEFIDWVGMPAEPPSRRWATRVEGVRVRLLARAGPDGAGRTSLASFIIDSTLADFPFRELLPRELRSGVEVEFRDTEAHDAEDRSRLSTDLTAPALAPGPSERAVLLRSPAGDVLAVARLLEIDEEGRRAQLRASACAWAMGVFVLLLALLFDWVSLSRRLSGLLLVTLAIVGARLLLLWTRLPARLLPREYGSPSLYGSSQLAGLLASPAELLLTGGALYLLCLAPRRYSLSAVRTHPRRTRVLVSLLAAGATSAVLGLTLSLARNSRMVLFERPAPLLWSQQLVPWAGLTLALLGAAELWGLLWVLVRRAAPDSTPRPSRVPTALALLLLALASGLLLQQLVQQLALEQLSSQYAPQLLEQSSRREVALKAALREVHDLYERDQPPLGPFSSNPDVLAYRSWINGELFHSGYKSSLDFYTPGGALVSHFAFDLPPLQESVPSIEALRDDLLVVREEFNPVPAVRQTLLHAEMPLAAAGASRAGLVVGHVLDEPENLPFLPWSRPYLAALGPGSPRSTGEDLIGGPHYVLYDASGTVLLTTLRQPPANSDGLQQTAEQQQEIRVKAGDQYYVGEALRQPDGRLHLLLLREASLLERLSASVRLALLGLMLFVLLELVQRFLRPRAIGAVLLALRGSFYRKLLLTLLLTSVLPVVGLALFLRGYFEHRSEVAVNNSATQLAGAAQRVVEDYSATSSDSGETGALNDSILYWLRRVVGQEIHVYEDGLLLASSKRELFSSGLLPMRLEGEVQRQLVRGGRQSLVLRSRLGQSFIPVAYAPVRHSSPRSAELVVAVPMVLEPREIERAFARLGDMILLATVALLGLQAVAAALLARTVARPVRDLVQATGQIAGGDYTARLQARTQDELAELVQGFNSMASALAWQRSDLERRRDYMEALLRHATTGVISIDGQGLLVTLNPAASALLSSCPARLQPGARLLTALAGSQELRPLARALESAAGLFEPMEVDLERDREPRRLRVVRVELPAISGDRPGQLILLDDVTDLMRSNQLAAWAEMARAIAHEIKNPLTPIQLSAEHLQRLLRDRVPLPTPEMEACLDTIIKQVRSLYEIAGEFSIYSKLPVLSPEPTDPVAFMRAAIGPYRAADPPGVTIEERYEPSPPVTVDRRVLSRAVINLVENALDAMPEGGTLTVAVAPDEEQGEVVLSVKDTGPGLAQEVRTRLFEPYFSTKSSGTGLGLAIVRRAVEAHHGRVEVESDRRLGTAFHIRLPAAAAVA